MISKSSLIDWSIKVFGKPNHPKDYILIAKEKTLSVG
jgi:hypothetical protein